MLHAFTGRGGEKILTFPGLRWKCTTTSTLLRSAGVTLCPHGEGHQKNLGCFAAEVLFRMSPDNRRPVPLMLITLAPTGITVSTCTRSTEKGVLCTVNTHVRKLRS